MNNQSNFFQDTKGFILDTPKDMKPDFFGVDFWHLLSFLTWKRVHSYQIHYIPLCILLKLSYMKCGSVSWGFKIVWSPHVIFKCRVMFAIKTPLSLGLTSLNFVCWSSIKFFCQNTHWNKHLMLSEQQRNNEKTCFVKGWDVTPKQNAKIYNKDDW